MSLTFKALCLNVLCICQACLWNGGPYVAAAHTRYSILLAEAKHANFASDHVTVQSQSVTLQIMLQIIVLAEQHTHI